MYSLVWFQNESEIQPFPNKEADFGLPNDDYVELMTRDYPRTPKDDRTAASDDHSKSHQDENILFLMWTFEMPVAWLKCQRCQPRQALPYFLRNGEDLPAISVIIQPQLDELGTTRYPTPPPLNKSPASWEKFVGSSDFLLSWVCHKIPSVY